MNVKKPSNARIKFEVPMDAATPCKRGTNNHSELKETEAKSDESNKVPKTKHACIVEAHESTRKRLESALPKIHEDHIAGKEYNSITTNWWIRCACVVCFAKERCRGPPEDLVAVLGGDLSRVRSS